MKKIFYILFLIIAFDLGESFTQPLAPRNRTKRRPVLESFVGGACVFCVPAENYIIGVGSKSCPFTWINYHAGSYAIPKDSLSPDLRTICGNSLHDSLKINGYPTAYIDRVDGPLAYTSWGSINDPQINGFASINMGVETKYNSNLNETDIDIELYRFSDYKYSFCYLSVMVIEDNVVAPQLISGTNWNNNYLHPNVFRDNITSCFGDRMDSLMIEVPLDRHYSYKIPNRIKAKNGYIVALITDSIGSIINSEVQPLTGGRTKVSGYLDDDRNEELVLEKLDSINRLVKFTSYEKDSIEYCFVISRDVQEWEASIRIGNKKSTDTIRLWMTYGQTVLVSIDLAPIPMRAYGHMLFQVLPFCLKDSCHTLYYKSFTIQPSSPVLVIYNSSANRDGINNKVNLWKPITNALDSFSCDNYVVIKEESFEAVYNFRRNKNIHTSSIYYSAGWSYPVFSQYTIPFFDTLMKAGTDLFLSGQDIANALQYSSWFKNTIGVTYVKDGDTSYNQVSVDIKDTIFGTFGSSKILPVFQNGNSANIFPDVITVDQLVNHKFLYNNKKTSVGFYKETTAGKLVFICVGMEMLEKDFASNIIRATHNWFEACPIIIHSVDLKHKPIIDEKYIKVKFRNNTLFIEYPERNINQHLKLFDLEGRFIADFKLAANTSISEVNSPNLQSGIYFYLVSDMENRKIHRGKFLLMGN